MLRSQQNPNILFDYWFRKPGAEHGWQLDYNFTEEGQWQYDFATASQTFIVAIAGISTGKSLTAVMAAAYFSCLLPDFKFLNVAKEGWQSQLMYTMLLDHAKDTKFDQLIVERPKRPYPKITIAYRAGERVISGTLEFMSVGESGDATNLFSWRGDVINIEEAGRIDNLSEIVSHLVTRLTGSTSTNRPYLGRLSLISNPWDNEDLWQLFDMAYNDAEDGLVFNIDTKDNLNTTEKQVKLALKLIPEDMHERFLTGKKPQGRGGYFSSTAIERCEDEILSSILIKGIRGKEKGFILEKAIFGIWHFQMPRKNGRIYLITGDPGIGNAPARNAPVVMVFDVTEAPKSAPMIAMWWGFGNGSIMPFVEQLFSWIEYYKPIYCGIDSTSTQRNMAEILNVDHTSNNNWSISSIGGLDFSGPKKYSYLVSLRLALESEMISWPHIVTGVGSQLGNYDDKKDKAAKSKLPQDLVATVAMGAFSIRSFYGAFEQDDSEEVIEIQSGDGSLVRDSRNNFSRRDARRESGVAVARPR